MHLFGFRGLHSFKCDLIHAHTHAHAHNCRRMSDNFVHKLLVRLVKEEKEKQKIDTFIDVCVNSFSDMNDFRRFFRETSRNDYDFWIENKTDQNVVREWWDTYLTTCIDDEICKKYMNELFDNKAAWIFLKAIYEEYEERIEGLVSKYLTCW